MAIYYSDIKVVGRSSGKSAVGMAAYRAAEKLYDEEMEKYRNFTYKTGVVHAEINLPDNAPERLQDRQTFWNEVMSIENRMNSQFLREFKYALPNELDDETNEKIIREFVKENFTDKGMPADWAYHDKEQKNQKNQNKHVHILTPTRPLTPEGEWQQYKEKKVFATDENGERIPIIDPETGEQKVDKNNRKQWKRITVQANEWNDQGNAEIWNASWERICNQYLTKEQQIDHRSYERQGVETIPQVHEGYAARQMEARGETSDLCELNRQIRKANEELKKENEIIEQAQQEKTNIFKKIVKLYENFKNPELKEPPKFGVEFVDRVLDNLWQRRKKWLEENREKNQEYTGYSPIDNLLRKANERADEYNRGQEQNRGKGRGKDDNTLTH